MPLYLSLFMSLERTVIRCAHQIVRGLSYKHSKEWLSCAIFSECSFQSSTVLLNPFWPAPWSCSRYTTFEIPPSASYLILTCEMGRLNNHDSCPFFVLFFGAVNTAFEQVFPVFENYECCGLQLSTGLKEAQKLAKNQWWIGELIYFTKNVSLPQLSKTSHWVHLMVPIQDEVREVKREWFRI